MHYARTNFLKCALFISHVQHLDLFEQKIYRSQQGVISDSPITPFERVGEVLRFSLFINSKFGRTDRHHTPHTGIDYVLGLVLCTAHKYLFGIKIHFGGVKK